MVNTMDISMTNEGDRYEITLSGWLDNNTSSEFEKTMEQIPESATWLTLDLTNLEYSSSAGVRQLVAAHKQMKGNMTLKNVTPEVLDVLQMIGLDKRMNIE